MTTAPYQVFARKYRPKTFSELVGQEVLVKTLEGSLSSGRIPHAFLMTGIRGTGKTTTARLLARGLNCVGADGAGGSTLSPCGLCQHCLSALQERHLDIIEFDAASRTGVDDMRELIDSVAYRPVSARYKVYIIDEVHMLSKSAFNALLKTLEEPPEHVKFFFATTDPQKIPVTILSRCWRFDLKPIAPEVLAPFLKGILEQEGITSEDEALLLLADAAEGSARDAVSLLDQAVNLGQGTVTTPTVERMLGRLRPQALLTLLQDLLQGNIQDSLAKSRNFQAHGASPLMIVEGLLDWIHTLSLEKALDKPLTISTITVPLLGRLWQLLLKGRTEIKDGPESTPLLEMLFIRVCYLSNMPPLDVLLKSETPMKTQDIVPNRAPPMPASFEEVIASLDSHKEALLATELRQGAVVEKFAPGILYFRCKHPFAETSLTKLRTHLKNWTGMPWDVQYIANAPDAPATEVQGETLEDKEIKQWAEEKSLARKDPLTQSILEAFPGAEIQTVHLKSEEI